MCKFLLYGHGGSFNHGAEAIVKTTIALIRRKYPDACIMLSTHFPEQDRKFGIDADEIIGPDADVWACEKAATNKQDKENLAKLMYREALSKITPDTVLLSVGGDNFCYSNWHRLAVFQQAACQRRANSILWGCSVNPDEITPEMRAVLNSYTTIIPRESVTFEALKKSGVTSDMQLLPDTAFFLEPMETAIPNGFDRFAGINLSPLILRRETKRGIILENIKNLLRYILRETPLKAALIPHVINPADNDFDILSEINSGLPEDCRSKVWLVSDALSAPEYKYIISKCAALVCSRTHASIAAYSSRVPALVIGYSIKSYGIASDLYMLDYFLDVKRLSDGGIVRDAFIRMCDDADQIQSNYAEVLPQYIEDRHLRYL